MTTKRRRCFFSYLGTYFTQKTLVGAPTVGRESAPVTTPPGVPNTAAVPAALALVVRPCCRVGVGPFAASICHSWGGSGPPLSAGLGSIIAWSSRLPREDYSGGARLLNDAVRHQRVSLLIRMFRHIRTYEQS